MRIHFKIATLLFSLAVCTTFASAGTISYTCDPNIDAASAGLCASLNTTIASDYSTIFSNATASIYIQFTVTDGLAENSKDLSALSYNQYRSLLSADSSGDTVDTDAVASLGLTDLSNSGSIAIGSALARALGATGAKGITANGAVCNNPGTSGCYDGIIDLDTPEDLASDGKGYSFGAGTPAANDFDIDSLVENQTDAVLGLSSCNVASSPTPTDQCGPNNAAAVDLFRYHQPGDPIFNDTSSAYFSYDSGQTAVGPNLNSGLAGGNYADFDGSCSLVQDLFACPGVALDISTDGGAEATILDTIGYNLNNPVNTSPAPTPEPGTLTLLGTGITAIAALVRRRRILAE